MMLIQLKQSAGLSRIAVLLLLGAGALGCACWPARADAQEKKWPTGSSGVVSPDGSFGVEDGSGEVPKFSADRFYEVLSSNHAFADEWLLGKRVRVHGFVSKIRRNAESETAGYVLVMAFDHAVPGRKAPLYLHFEFRVDARKALAAVDTDQRVTVEGVCTQPKSEEVCFKDCKFIKVDDKVAR